MISLTIADQFLEELQPSSEHLVMNDKSLKALWLIRIILYPATLRTESPMSYTEQTWVITEYISCVVAFAVRNEVMDDQ